MKRAAIYARYSSDLQDERSISDQVELCKSFAAKNGWAVAETYSDEAVSGASEHGRLGFARMLADARQKKFSIIVAEDMDRLSRSDSGAPKLRSDMAFLEIEIHTVADGKITRMHASLKGLMGAMFLENLALHTHRGMQGVVRDGRSAGGIVYGYRVVKKFGTDGELIRGLREIDADQSAIVRRIFKEFIAGKSPRAIAHALNLDGVAPPRGKSWNASTINGSGQRGTGILRNALYIGRLEWNKVRMLKDPATGRRISRPNPKSEWQICEVPDLAIVPAAIFAAVQNRKALMAGVLPTRQRRPKRLLSGLLRCASCGGGMSTYGSDNTSRRRVRCTTFAENGTCKDPRTFYLDVIERVVVDALKAELRAPDVIKEFLREYQAERRRLAAGSTASRARLESRLGTLRREIERLVDAIAKGQGEAAILGPRSSALDAERRAIEEKLAAEPPKVVTLHPGALARYEGLLDNLQESLGDGRDAKAAAALRDLVESVVVRRGAGGRPEVEIRGRLNALLAHAGASQRPGGSLVAGAGYVHTAQPILYRLRAAA